MSQTRDVQIQFKLRLLPFLLGLLLALQLLTPYKGWVVLMIALGGAWLISYLWIRELAKGLTLVREMRFGWAQVGDALHERFTIINDGRVPTLWVAVIDHSTMPGYDASIVQAVGAGGSLSWLKTGACSRRGLYILGPTSLETADPLGFYTLRIDYFASSTMMVTPPIVSLPEINIAPGGRAGEGRLRVKALEETTSAATVRDYLPGDSLRLIHWPTSARQNELFVRTFETTPSSDWWIFLDLDKHVQVGEGEDSTMEHAIILAASLANRGLQGGQSVGLVMHGRELVWLPPSLGDDHRWEILRNLALVEAGAYSLAELLESARPSLRHRSSVILITPSTQGDWLNTAALFTRKGIVPTVLLLDPVAFGGDGNPKGMLASIAALGLGYHVITPQLLDNQEIRPGGKGKFEVRVTPLGRAIVERQWAEQPWKELA
ncbi:MAG: DUF58 domain-containing protein [Anaerolineales bacterium]|nr:DUF58 domain-containing protein [Anaerolineales bacterium]